MAGKIEGIFCVAVLVVFGMCLTAVAGDVEGEAAGNDKAAELKQQMNTVRGELRALGKQMNNFKKQCYKDPEIQELKKAMDEARKAYEAKFREKIAAMEGGAELIAKEDDLKAKIHAIKTEISQLHRKKKHRDEGVEKKHKADKEARHKKERREKKDKDATGDVPLW